MYYNLQATQIDEDPGKRWSTETGQGVQIPWKCIHQRCEKSQWDQEEGTEERKIKGTDVEYGIIWSRDIDDEEER